MSSTPSGAIRTDGARPSAGWTARNPVAIPPSVVDEATTSADALTAEKAVELL
jgi:hypothetical protein